MNAFIKNVSCFGFVSVLVFFSIQAKAEHPLPDHPFFEKPFLLGGHRGGMELGPESTAQTFNRLVSVYPKALVETDARVTKDGRVIFLHDEKVDRTTNGTGSVHDLTLAEVQALDAAHNWTPDKGETFPHRGKGYKIPTMAEGFAVAPDNNWMVELKPGPVEHAEIIAKEIVRLGMADRVILASFDPKLMARAHAVAPQIAVCYDSDSRVSLVAALRSDDWDSYEPEGQLVTIGYNRMDQYGVTFEDLAKIQAKGIPICMYTINRSDQMNGLLSAGVDSILTNRPEQLYRAIGKVRDGEQ